MSEQPLWQIRLTQAAEADFQQIVRWSAQQFGKRQAIVYANLIGHTLEELAHGPDIPGVRRRDEIARGLRTIHVSRKGRHGRHFVIFRVSPDQGARAIEVLRLLHDAMDVERHLPDL